MTFTQDEIDRELTHFIRLARTGKCAGASGGQRRAARLARAVLDDVPGLDQDARNGLWHFIRLVAAAPNSAEDILIGRKTN